MRVSRGIVIAGVAVMATGGLAASASAADDLPAKLKITKPTLTKYVNKLMGKPGGKQRIRGVSCSKNRRSCTVRVNVTPKEQNDAFHLSGLTYPTFRVLFRDPKVKVGYVTVYGRALDRNGNTIPGSTQLGTSTCGNEAAHNRLDSSWAKVGANAIHVICENNGIKGYD